ncbi:MAG: DNA-binding protein [Halobacteriales archaeon]
MSDTSVFAQMGTTEATSANERSAAREAVEHRPSVEQASQAKVDHNHPDTKGLTRIAEERIRARELEIERTRRRWDRRPKSDREARCRDAAARGSAERRRAFERRAASVDPCADPDRGDPRAELSRGTMATVNREAERLSNELPGFSRAAISRRLARRVVDGQELSAAVVATLQTLRTAPGQPIPIAAVGDVGREEVTIEGEVTTLWEPSHPSIQQVGLIEDDSGRIKFTAWRKSAVAMVAEGDHVRLRHVAKNWYDGRVSVALTGWSSVTFLEA